MTTNPCHKVTVNGVTFKSMYAACNHYGLDYTTLCKTAAEKGVDKTEYAVKKIKERQDLLNAWVKFCCKK